MKTNNTSSQEDVSWLEHEVNGSTFKDHRLTKRFKLLLEKLWKGMGNSIPFACQDRAQTKAAYRFLSNTQVSRTSGQFDIVFLYYWLAGVLIENGKWNILRCTCWTRPDER